MYSTRRQVLRSVGIFGALFVSRSLVACAVRSETLEASEANAELACSPPVIGTNHGHALVVPTADIAAATTKTYSIQGTSGHPHTVEITAEQFADLAAGKTLDLVSSRDAGHTHTVKIVCAAKEEEA